MRIILNCEEVVGANRKKIVRLRIGYCTSSGDTIRVNNCGIEIYNALVDGFKNEAFKDKELVVEGERR